MPGPSHRTAWRVAVACGLLAGSARAQGGQDAIRLVYQAPGECPNAEEFAARVRQAGSQVRISDETGPGRVFTVTIDGDGRGSRTGKLRIDKDGVTVGSRDVVGGSCEEVVHVLAFAVVLAYEPEARESTLSAEPPLAATPPRVVVPGATVPDRAIPAAAMPALASPRREGPPVAFARWWSLSAHATIATDPSPNPTFGAGAALELGLRSKAVVPYMHLGLEYAASASDKTTRGEVAFQGVYAALEACVARPAGGWLWVAGCARADVGARIVAGESVVNARTVVRPWLGIGPSLHARLRVSAPWFVDLGGAVLFAAVQDQVTLDGNTPHPLGVYDVGLVTLIGDLGLGIEFR